MAVAPAVLDAVSQGIIDKVMEKVRGEMQAEFDAQRKAESSNITVVRGKEADEILKEWSRIPDGHPYTPPSNKEDRGIRGARVLRGLAACQGDVQRIPGWLSDKQRDKQTAKIMERSMSTGNFAAGGALVLDEFLVGEFYPMLRDMVSVWDLGARMVPMPHGTLSIAGFDTGALVGWVGEGKGRPGTRANYGRVKLSSKKAYGNVAISKDLLEESDFNIDQMVRDDVLGAFVELITNSTLHGPASEHGPLGVALEAGRTQVTIGALLTADDPPKFIKALRKAKVPFDFNNAGWVFNSDVWLQFYNLKTSTGAYHFREEMNTGRLLGYRYIVTESVETGSTGHKLTHIFFGKWSELIVGITRNFTAEIFREAVMRQDEDGNEVNAMEDDVIFLKCTQKLDTKLRIKKAIAHAEDVWTEA